MDKSKTLVITVPHLYTEQFIRKIVQDFVMQGYRTIFVKHKDKTSKNHNVHSNKHEIKPNPDDKLDIQIKNTKGKIRSMWIDLHAASWL